MRAVVQRVTSAEVTVEGLHVARMEAGLLALVGVGRTDDEVAAKDLAHRLVHLRIFADDEGRMNRSLLDTQGTLAVVSQFTLYGDTRQGRRPYFGDAAPAAQAEPLIASVANAAEGLGAAVVRGRFQAHMKIASVNDGPVTLLLDTEKRF